MKYIIFAFVLLFSIGCSKTPKPAVIHIRLVNHSVLIKGFKLAVIREITHDSSMEEWQSLIPFYSMPADTDLKNYQPMQPGTYLLKDSTVIFTPDTAFKKNQTYFMRYFKFNEGNTFADFMKGKKTLGKTKYTDLVIK